MEKTLFNYDQPRKEAANEIAALVGATLGPWGHNVDFHSAKGAPVMLRDGLKVIEHFKPKPSLLRAIRDRMLEAAYTTASGAGDGTTTTTLLIAKMYANVVDAMEASNEPVSRRAIAQAIRAAGADVCAYLRENSIKIDMTTDEGRDILLKAATLAGGNMREVGEAISTLLTEIGTKGQVIMDVTHDVDSIQYELKPGYHMDSGLISTRLLPPGLAQVSVRDAYVQLVKGPIANYKELKPLIERWQKFCNAEQRMVPWVLMCGPISADARTTMIERADKDGNVMPWYTVSVNNSHATFDDLEAITGIKAASPSEGRSHMHKDIEIGASVPNIVLSMTKTVVNGADGVLEASGLIDRILDACKDLEPDQRADADKRIARLRGKVGIVKVPAGTSARMSWLREVLEDAYKAASAAIDGGVSPGAGISLIRAASVLDGKLTNPSSRIGIVAVQNALSVVTRTLMDNGGVEMSTIHEILNYTLNKSGRSTILMTTESLQQMLAQLSVSNVPIADEAFSLPYSIDAVEGGILDATQALTDAVTAATKEVADWVETSVAVIPEAFNQQKN